MGSTALEINAQPFLSSTMRGKMLVLQKTLTKNALIWDFRSNNSGVDLIWQRISVFNCGFRYCAMRTLPNCDIRGFQKILFLSNSMWIHMCVSSSTRKQILIGMWNGVIIYNINAEAQWIGLLWWVWLLRARDFTDADFYIGVKYYSFWF